MDNDANKNELEDFDPFNFYILDDDKKGKFVIYNLTASVCFKAGRLAGFNVIDSVAQYSHPDCKDHPAI